MHQFTIHGNGLMSNTIRESILLLVNDLKKVRISKDIHRELYGFGNGEVPYPPHRILYGHIIVDCERDNGEVLQNYELLLESKNIQQKESYIDFKRIVITTGLVDLGNQIEYILHSKFNPIEVVLLNRMFKDQFTIFKGSLEVADEDIIAMLEYIRNKYL